MCMPFVFNDCEYLKIEAARINARVSELNIDGYGKLQSLARTALGGKVADLVSVYGYPRFLCGEDSPSTIKLSDIWDDLRLHYKAENYVAGYFRLDVDQSIDVIGVNDTQLRHVGNVVYLDLQQDYETIQKGFRKNLRYDIRKLENHYEPLELTDKLKAFHEIYSQNMARVGASDHYFFSLDYLRALCEIDGVECHLIGCDGELAAGAITVQQGKTLFYHLGATAQAHLASGPIKILLADLIQRNCQKSFEKMILGGGLGGAQDSLLRFKLGFSKNQLQIFSLQAIFDRPSYERLCEGYAASDFFPRYRQGL